MTHELELYYRNFRDLFRNEGWKQLITDLKENAVLINSVEVTKDSNDLYFRKGQLTIIANLLNLEAQIDISEKQAEEEEVETN
tara:strand:+ start:26 stop:274 length:249 start_codon:yes stop_codon:yes gene_type:complete